MRRPRKTEESSGPSGQRQIRIVKFQMIMWTTTERFRGDSWIRADRESVYHEDDFTRGITPCRPFGSDPENLVATTTGWHRVSALAQGKVSSTTGWHGVSTLTQCEVPAATGRHRIGALTQDRSINRSSVDSPGNGE